MTAWSTPALLLVGVAAGPHGLNLLSPSVLLALDPGIAMALAMLGVFVGLTVDPFQPQRVRAISASSVRAMTTAVAVGAAAFAAATLWLGAGTALWLPALMVGVCAAGPDAAADVNIDDVLVIVAGGLIIGAIRAPGSGPLLPLMLALVGIAVSVAVAGWLLVGQTSSEESNMYSLSARCCCWAVRRPISLSPPCSPAWRPALCGTWRAIFRRRASFATFTTFSIRWSCLYR